MKKREAMRKLLQGALDRWPEIGSDESINGADVVDWLADFLRRVKKTLAPKHATTRGGRGGKNR
jgi:hypothetical protein